MFLHTLLFQNQHILDPKQACNFILMFSTFVKKCVFFSLSLNVGYTSIHDIAMVLREENVYSYDNATMFGQGDLSHSLY